MAKKNSKPYSSTVKTSYKKRTTSKTKGTKKDKLDVTTRIRVDEIRLNDAESLDTSFLEGRVEKKSTTKDKEKILKDSTDRIKVMSKIRKVLFGIAIVCSIILGVLVLGNFVLKIGKEINKSKIKTTDVNEEKAKKKVIDSNYLFVGDFYTDNFDFKDFDLDYHYVKTSKENMTTDDILDNMKANVYDYNPSIVFFELGIMDLDDNKSVDDIVDNMSEIIDLTKKNRPYAEIYIESIYPLDVDHKDYDDDLVDDVNNDDIVKLNKKLKTLSKEKNVHYLDVYSMLVKDKKLDGDYTDNGIGLNKDGYRQVLKMINKIVLS